MPRGRVKNEIPGRARRALHDIGCRFFHGESERGNSIRNKIDPEQLDRNQRHRPTNERSEKNERDLARVRGEKIMNELLDVVVNAAAFFNGIDDGSEVVVG